MEGRITVQRANVILQVPEDAKQYYMNQGYSVINDKGEIVEEATLTDVASLQAKVAALLELVKTQTETINSLKEDNEALKDELMKAVEGNKKSSKSEKKEK